MRKEPNFPFRRRAFFALLLLALALAPLGCGPDAPERGAMQRSDPGRGGELPPAPVQPGGVAATTGGAVGVVGVVGVRGLMLEVYDARNLDSLGKVGAGEGPTHVVSGPGDRFYVADTSGGAVLVCSARLRPALVERVELPGSPYGMAVDPEREELWVALTAENRVVRYAPDGGTPREPGRYPTVRQSNSVAADPASGRVLVAGAADGELQIIPPR